MRKAIKKKNEKKSDRERPKKEKKRRQREGEGGERKKCLQYMKLFTTIQIKQHYHSNIESSAATAI